MKRSRSIRLVLMGSVGLVALGGCHGSDDQAANTVYQDEAQCAAENDPTMCGQAFAEARAAHASTAPAYVDLEACESKFGAGNCTPAEGTPSADQMAAGEGTHAAASSGSSFFMPLMMGYMMGNLMNGRAMAQPVWRDARNTAFVGGRAAGTIDPASVGRGAPVQVARGGFGGNAVRSAAG